MNEIYKRELNSKLRGLMVDNGEHITSICTYSDEITSIENKINNIKVKLADNNTTIAAILAEIAELE